MKSVIAEVKSKEKTIIFSTHLMETAEKLCDDILLINKARKVISGSLREIKQSYGRNIVSIRCTEGEEILQPGELVERVVEHSDEAEVFLRDGANGQELLERLIGAGASISKFEMVEASLNDIFIDAVNS